MPDAIDAERTAFSQKMIAILNGAALNLAVAIGYRTRLFDVMAGLERPHTAEAIAARAGLNHRYVREWLGVMATGGIVELTASDSAGSRYRLPAAHAPLLTRAAGNGNLAVYTQEIPLLTNCALEPVLAGFKSGEGIPYDRYPAFQAFMTELSEAKTPGCPGGSVSAVGGRRPIGGAPAAGDAGLRPGLRRRPGAPPDGPRLSPQPVSGAGHLSGRRRCRPAGRRSRGTGERHLRGPGCRPVMRRRDPGGELRLRYGL